MSATEKPEVEPGRLEMRAEPNGSSHLIVLSGELDIYSSPQVEEELRQAESGEAEEIVIDLSAVDFIDSSGIALLVHALRLYERSASRLRVIPSRSDDVQRLLELCGLDQKLYTRDGALRR